MAFAYYQRLSPREQALYRQSDGVSWITLPAAESLHAAVAGLRAGLETDDRAAVQSACSSLSQGMTAALGVGSVEVVVLAVRPTLRESELHGLYTRDGKRARIQVWMRTARHRRVVAFRTFLRTLLHELVHHLDYTYLKLADSYHTEGFFKRESSLFRQLVPEAA